MPPPAGQPPPGTGAGDEWKSSVAWNKGNALDPESYMSLVFGADAVISCVGYLGVNSDDMLKVGLGGLGVCFEKREMGVNSPCCGRLID